MTGTSLLHQTTTFACTFALTWVSCTFTAPSEAQLDRGQARSSSLLVKQNRSGGGRPEGTRRGGSRGDCGARNEVLMPLTQSDDEAGATIKTHPTFWVYVPYAPNEVASGEFSLQDAQRNDIYRTRFTLPATPGIVSITIPADKPPLEINKQYSWHFKLDCPRQNATQKQAFVDGIVKRIALNPELERELNAAKNLQERLDFYAKNGIWYERLNELALLRLAEPKSTNDNWSELLKSAGLEYLAQYPIIGSIKPNFPTE